jgi:hypothetical protein
MDLQYTTDFVPAVRAYMNTILKGDPLAYQQTVEFLQERGYRTDSLMNDRAVSKDENFKHAISMPEILGSYVFLKFPEILKTKANLYKFMRAFPQFCVSPDVNKTKYHVGNFASN